MFIRQEEPGVSTMDISTGHMVLNYMEDHLNNKQRLEQEWVGLCAYEAEPASTSVAFKVSREADRKRDTYKDAWVHSKDDWCSSCTVFGVSHVFFISLGPVICIYCKDLVWFLV